MSGEHLVTRDYWQREYQSGNGSGRGSSGEFATWKADVVNAAIHDHDVTTLLDVGCGDGEVASLIDVTRYLGIDVAPAAVEIARERNADDPAKHFEVWGEFSAFPAGMFDAVISLEVLMHVLEESLFIDTLAGIFASARELVLLQVPLVPMFEYQAGSHDRHRYLLPYLAEHVGRWALTEIIVHPSSTARRRAHADLGEMASDFLVFELAGRVAG